jgi:hypothetical protein
VNQSELLATTIFSFYFASVALLLRFVLNSSAVLTIAKSSHVWKSPRSMKGVRHFVVKSGQALPFSDNFLATGIILRITLIFLPFHRHPSRILGKYSKKGKVNPEYPVQMSQKQKMGEWNRKKNEQNYTGSG